MLSCKSKCTSKINNHFHRSELQTTLEEMFNISKPRYKSSEEYEVQGNIIYVRRFREKVKTLRRQENCNKYKEDFEAIFGTYPQPCEYCLVNQDCKKLIHQLHPVFKS